MAAPKTHSHSVPPPHPATSASKPVSGNAKGGIVDDFMYGSNVASAHIYIRMGFMRKVYGIVTAQLVATMAVCCLFMMSEAIQEYIQHNHWMLTVSMFGTLGVLFALMWKRHETPTNFILLAVFTLLESYCVGVVVTFYKVPSVIEALLVTVGLSVGLILYTLQSKRDFSSWHAGAMMGLYALIVAGFVQILFPVPILHLAVSFGGAALFCVFIVVDTHLIMAKLSPEEYIMAAINIYLDILNLFLYILRILGERK